MAKIFVKPLRLTIRRSASALKVSALNAAVGPTVRDVAIWLGR